LLFACVANRKCKCHFKFRKNAFFLQENENVLEVEVHHCQDSEIQASYASRDLEEVEEIGGKNGGIQHFGAKIEGSQHFGGKHKEKNIFGGKILPKIIRRRSGRIPRYVGDHTFTVHQDLFK